MRQTGLFLIACMTAALAPCWQAQPSERVDDLSFPGWPEQVSNRPLSQLHMSSREQEFAKSFPGKIGHFTDGEREYVIRWVTSKTRKLHPAADCMRGSGYQIHPLPLRVDEQGITWGAFEAGKEGATLQVEEKISSVNGKTWTDVSAWYWAEDAEDSSGPWWAITRISQIPLAVETSSNP